jgi:hypothetical protein
MTVPSLPRSFQRVVLLLRLLGDFFVVVPAVLATRYRGHRPPHGGGIVAQSCTHGPCTNCTERIARTTANRDDHSALVPVTPTRHRAGPCILDTVPPTGSSFGDSKSVLAVDERRHTVISFFSDKGEATKLGMVKSLADSGRTTTRTASGAEETATSSAAAAAVSHASSRRRWLLSLLTFVRAVLLFIRRQAGSLGERRLALLSDDWTITRPRHDFRKFAMDDFPRVVCIVSRTKNEASQHK